MTDTPLFQATADPNTLPQAPVATNTQPTQLFQPAKNAFGDFTKGVADFGRGSVDDVVGIGKDIGAVRSEPNPDGGGLFQAQKPLESLTNIGGKVLKT